MRTLDVKEMAVVSGAGNYADKHGPGSGNSSGGGRGKSNGNPRYNDPGVADCNKSILVGATLGAIGGGLAGAALGIAGAAFGSDCSKSSASSCNNNSKNNSSRGGNNIGGQCRW
ncbi:hypothetical protein ED28_02370 [[Pantoea] beijingensis]|uniref:Bacteriocin n=1 Tax=[Pantoea] beijingensis TaxID=1324864 RepID=A0A443II77_9GAMM|nr:MULTISPECIES: hypothetical protein [Erwiniaceae]RWR03855.1 hypothetical protein ED28_02370 [[Pantoea] beijingensis]